MPTNQLQSDLVCINNDVKVRWQDKGLVTLYENIWTLPCWKLFQISNLTQIINIFVFGRLEKTFFLFLQCLQNLRSPGPKDIVFVAFVKDNATMSSIRYFENHVSYFVQNRRK